MILMSARSLTTKLKQQTLNQNVYLHSTYVVTRGTALAKQLGKERTSDRKVR